MKAGLIAAGFILGLSSLCLAQHEPAERIAPATTPAGAVEEAEAPMPHPLISEDAGWTLPVTAVILALFAAAIPVGMVIRARTPNEAPAAPTHDSHGSADESGHAHDSHNAHH